MIYFVQCKMIFFPYALQELIVLFENLRMAYWSLLPFDCVYLCCKVKGEDQKTDQFYGLSEAAGRLPASRVLSGVGGGGQRRRPLHKCQQQNQRNRYAQEPGGWTQARSVSNAFQSGYHLFIYLPFKACSCIQLPRCTLYKLSPQSEGTAQCCCCNYTSLQWIIFKWCHICNVVVWGNVFGHWWSPELWGTSRTVFCFLCSI